MLPLVFLIFPSVLPSFSISRPAFSSLFPCFARRFLSLQLILLHFHQWFVMFIGFLESNLGVALLLLVALLTCGMMVRFEKQRAGGGLGAGLGGRARRPKA